MTTWCKMLCVCPLILLLCSAAGGDEQTADKNVRVANATFTTLAEAHAAKDHKALANLFTPQGEFVDGEGNVFQGRDAISGEFRALFERNTRSTLKVTAESAREISPGVLSVDGVATITGRAESSPDHIDFAALLIKQSDGKWLLASIRSEGERAADTPHAHLKRLEWLIGDWIDESAESTMHTTTHWSADGQFLISEFSIRVVGSTVMKGTQRIGWDASLEQFRSWVFDSEGGYAEGIWTEHEDHWTVSSTGVRPGGEDCSATHTYEPDGPDAYLFSVTDRLVDDEELPDFTAHVVRTPPEPETAAKVEPASKAK